MSRANEHTRAELIDLFDRFLVLVSDATRRFGQLFPYNHLCRRIQAMLIGSSALVVVSDEDGRELATFAVVWRAGELRRAEPTGSATLVWSIPRARLEHAAVQPWVYLADPKRLGFAWFHDSGSRGAPSVVTGPPSMPTQAAALPS